MRCRTKLGLRTSRLPAQRVRQEEQPLARPVRVIALPLGGDRVAAQCCGTLCCLGQRCGNRALQHLLREPARIRRWSAANHIALVNSSSFGTAAQRAQVAPLAAQMDFKPEEMAFNAGALMARDHASRVAWYRANRYHALNHGEGGCYSVPASAAAADNHARVMAYINTALQMDRVRRAFPPGSAMWLALRMPVLQAIGDALHVAQDRGSHSEGGIGEGHDHPDPNYDCDDPSQNTAGWARARINTAAVLAAVTATGLL